MVPRLEISCSLRFLNLLSISNTSNYSNYMPMYIRYFCVLQAFELWLFDSYFWVHVDLMLCAFVLSIFVSKLPVLIT